MSIIILIMILLSSITLIIIMLSFIVLSIDMLLGILLNVFILCGITLRVIKLNIDGHYVEYHNVECLKLNIASLSHYADYDLA